MDAASVLEPEHKHNARARQVLELSERDLWFASFGCGGNAQYSGLAEFLRGHRDLSKRDYDTLAAALNDMCSDAGLPRSVPSSADLASPSAS